MQRRDFLTRMLAGTAVSALKPAPAQQASGEVFLEKAATGAPHKGKVLAAIQPHSDDISVFAAGTVAKLIHEGYTGYLLRASNDDMGDAGWAPGHHRRRRTGQRARYRRAVADHGLQSHFDLNYNNHRMADISLNELICRLIFLVRLLKLDTMLCWDPWRPRRREPRPLRARALR